MNWKKEERALLQTLKVARFDGYLVAHLPNQGMIHHLLFDTGPTRPLCLEEWTFDDAAKAAGRWTFPSKSPDRSNVCPRCLVRADYRCWRNAHLPSGRCESEGNWESPDFPGMRWCESHRGLNDLQIEKDRIIDSMLAHLNTLDCGLDKMRDKLESLYPEVGKVPVRWGSTTFRK